MNDVLWNTHQLKRSNYYKERGDKVVGFRNVRNIKKRGGGGQKIPCSWRSVSNGEPARRTCGKKRHEAWGEKGRSPPRTRQKKTTVLENGSFFELPPGTQVIDAKRHFELFVVIIY